MSETKPSGLGIRDSGFVPISPTSVVSHKFLSARPELVEGFRVGLQIASILRQAQDERRSARTEKCKILAGHCTNRESRVTNHAARCARGFTLVELVVTIALASIVVAFAAMFIVTPVKSYQAQARRAELVDSADAVLRLIGRDVRAALPNSIRIVDNGSTVALEVLNAVDAVRYRDSGATADPTQELDFSSPDDSFASISQFDGITRPFSTTTHYLSIYNVGVPGADAYALTNVITPPGTTITIDNSITPDEDVITMSPSFRFAYGSPGKRVYLVSGPVTYLCDESARTIRRYGGYSIAANQTNRDSAGELLGAGATAAMVANDVNACQFEYSPGTAQRAGVVSLRVSIVRDGETISLVHQVHVGNAP